ncbi:uncharacterized protein LOC121504774 [Cheilinus undulatus]|uniref:uncharacterized protein LOC121504774 n=1 Tax=Cheilinus undulatus TaxID=241271 RepID=UPI001BD2E75F|nr:uncharacterized protein LOC121504774 [Cheilinus undulatus]
MKLLLSSLLLASFCTLSSWSVSSDAVVVNQTPDVSVTVGEAVNISCCWNGEFDRGRINWTKNQITVKRDRFSYSNNTQGSQPKKTSGCSYLSFQNITRADSGSYVCNLTVELPVLLRVEGGGTVITVTVTNNSTKEGSTSDSPPSPVIISLAVVAPLLLIALLCVCMLRRKQGSAKAARVIYEVPHIDSDVPDMDKHSTSSSRGSSQWCQVPVYESFDYFERGTEQQNKESR